MTTETAAPSPLYEAGVNFLVSERTESNAWEQVAKFVQHHFANGGGMNALKREFRIVEVQLKKDFEVGTMPVAWRSAKSHAVNAIKQGIPLLNESGDALPKTDVGKLIKARKLGTLTRTDFDKFKDHLNAAIKLCSTLTGAEQYDAHMMVLGWAAVVTPAKAA